MLFLNFGKIWKIMKKKKKFSAESQQLKHLQTGKTVHSYEYRCEKIKKQYSHFKWNDLLLPTLATNVLPLRSEVG